MSGDSPLNGSSSEFGTRAYSMEGDAFDYRTIDPALRDYFPSSTGTLEEPANHSDLHPIRPFLPRIDIPALENPRPGHPHAQIRREGRPSPDEDEERDETSSLFSAPFDSPIPSPSVSSYPNPEIPTPSTDDDIIAHLCVFALPNSLRAPERKSHAKRQREGHVPRPRNAFILFRCDFVRHSKAQVVFVSSSSSKSGASSSSFSGAGAGTGTHPKQASISRDAGCIWRSLTADEKAPWVRLAAFEKREHAALYPDYRYVARGEKSKLRGKKGIGEVRSPAGLLMTREGRRNGRTRETASRILHSSAPVMCRMGGAGGEIGDSAIQDAPWVPTPAAQTDIPTRDPSAASESSGSSADPIPQRARSTSPRVAQLRYRVRMPADDELLRPETPQRPDLVSESVPFTTHYSRQGRTWTRARTWHQAYQRKTNRAYGPLHYDEPWRPSGLS